MKNNIFTFKRVEMKYMLDSEKKAAFIEALGDRLVPDDYPESDIMNIYYDTMDYHLARKSLERPIYKEKLRLRTYGVPNGDTTAFLEIKKKFKGIVYKRRISLPYGEAISAMNEGTPINKEGQITREIEAFRTHYGSLSRKTVVSYHRTSYYLKDDPSFRITFDNDIRYRNSSTDLSSGIFGKKLLADDMSIMEIKVGGAMPLSIAHTLSSLDIKKGRFSKYGSAYENENLSSCVGFATARALTPAFI